MSSPRESAIVISVQTGTSVVVLVVIVPGNLMVVAGTVIVVKPATVAPVTEIDYQRTHSLTLVN